MSRWIKEDASEKAAYLRDWVKTEKGKAYRERSKERAREWRKNNREQFKEKQKIAYSAVRLEALKNYSGGKPKCACCGEDEILFLHIDHINGDGAEHRRTLKAELGYYPGGNNLPYWLKKNGWPGGFQILCANCNLAKRTGNTCPHQFHGKI